MDALLCGVDGNVLHLSLGLNNGSVRAKIKLEFLLHGLNDEEVQVGFGFEYLFNSLVYIALNSITI
jgi:hypothetical protein